MTRNRAFIRKICYLAAMGLLLPLLYWLGHPSAADSEAAKGSPGGKLAQIRTEQKLSQAELGQIDPTSETIKLATFGLRPIAANILWAKAINYKMKKDWTNLSATLNQLTKIQPHFIDVWRFQAWNLSYNCSTEFDDYRERYAWVLKGIDFLKLGIDYNEHEPRLFKDTGWVISQKIGRADEHKQFRAMFIADDDFHGTRPKDERDNWLVGKSWYRRAEKIVDTQDRPIIGDSPLIFRSKAPMCQMNFAEAIEEDGTFGEKAKTAWENAAREWRELGQMPIPTSQDFEIRLGDQERRLEKADAMSKEIDSYAPGMRQQIYEEKMTRLSDKQREALATPPAERNEEQFRMAAEAQALLQVSDKEVAGKVEDANRAKAEQLVKDAKLERDLARTTDSYRQIVNYDHWKLRAEVEQTDEMILARQLVYAGDSALEQGNLPLASDSFAAGSAAWMKVLERFPQLVPDRDTVEHVQHVIDQYQKTLEQRDELFPEDFALAGFVQVQIASEGAGQAAVASFKKANEALEKEDLKGAEVALNSAINSWRNVINAVPSLQLLSDRATAQAITETVRKYAEVLKQLKQPFPDNFTLQSFIWVQVEHDALTQTARKAAEEAASLARKNEPSPDDLAAAATACQQSFTAWREVLDKFPSAAADNNIADEIMLTVDLYKQILEKQGKTLPDDFILKDVVDRR